MSELVHVGHHADILESGQGIAPGDRINPSQLSKHDRHLIENGTLVTVDSFNETDDNRQSSQDLQARARELGIDGRSKMSADELRAAVAEREAEEANQNAS